MSPEDNSQIIIDISTTDARLIKEQEYFLQKRAFNKVKDLLKKELLVKIEKNAPLTGQRTHNSIFVNGGRGSGKTQFLLNIQRFLEETNNVTYQTENSKFMFLEQIDPTLLHSNESFLTIILAKVLNHLEKMNILTNQDNDIQKKFYQQLSKIAQAIDGISSSKDERTALEKISQNQTGLQLEEFLHQFFQLIITITNKERIVILIDDVDMALEKGFEVLEVVRMYLSSPHVIPIVTGDLNLYRKIVFNHFDEKLNKKVEVNSKTDISCDESIIECQTTDLSISYLTKVFPLHRRVNLKNIYELAQYNDILFKYEGKDDCQELLKSKENHDGFFYERAEELFNLDSAKDKFIENLFSNPLRNLKEYFHGECNRDTLEKNLIKEEKLGFVNFIQLEEQLNTMKNTELENYLNDTKGLRRKKIAKEKLIFEILEKIKTSALLKIQKIETRYNLKIMEGVITWETYLSEAYKYFQNNIFQKTIEYCEESLKLKENDEAYLLMGNAYQNMKKYLEAIIIYKKALKINDKEINIYRNLAFSYYELAYKEDNEDYYLNSIENYKYALKIKEEKDLLTGLGLVYLELLEFYLIHKKPNEFEKLKNKFLQKFRQSEEEMKVFSMLNILYDLEYNANLHNKESLFSHDYEIWENKYLTVKYTWEFDDLKKWKQRKSLVKDAIEMFEVHWIIESL